MGGHPFPNSIGYAGDCSIDSVNYVLNGAYQWFDATVGVNDDASQDDQTTAVEFTVIVNPGNKQINAQPQWEQPASFHVPVVGATELTLETNTDLGDCLSGESEAVWGNARLVPGP